MSSEKKVKLNTGESLSSFLSHVFAEGVKSSLAQKALTEKEKQAAASGGNSGDDESDTDDLFGTGGGNDSSGSSGSDDDDGQISQSSKTMDDETEKLKKGDVKPKDIAEKLNAIRAGKSFKDTYVAKAMDEYINSLSRAERVALYAFMKGIAQIVTGEVPSQDAEDPSDDPSDVKMQKGTPKNTKHIQPNVIKGGNKGGDQKPNNGQQNNSSQEDTSAPAPITPKKR